MDSVDRSNVARNKNNKTSAARKNAVRRAKNTPPGPAKLLVLRLLAWTLVCLAVGGVAYLLVWGGRTVLFTNNPHFTLEHIRIKTTGQIHPEEILRRLASAGIQKGKTNLFAIDPGSLRQRLEAYVLIDHVEILRRLPDTLEIHVFDREPVAQITRPGGRLLDPNGWILPARNDPQTRILPVIAPIPDVDAIPTGVRIRDKMVQGALRLLLLCRTEGYNRILDIESVQIDRAGKRLFCHLRPHGTFRQKAVVVLPIEGIEWALRRVRCIVRERQRARQTTSFIDATYEINVPVRP